VVGDRPWVCDLIHNKEALNLRTLLRDLVLGASVGFVHIYAFFFIEITGLEIKQCPVS
jgi:hypothetical protein